MVSNAPCRVGARPRLTIAPFAVARKVSLVEPRCLSRDPKLASGARGSIRGSEQQLIENEGKADRGKQETDGAAGFIRVPQDEGRPN